MDAAHQCERQARPPSYEAPNDRRGDIGFQMIRGEDVEKYVAEECLPGRAPITHMVTLDILPGGLAQMTVALINHGQLAFAAASGRQQP